MTKTNPFTGKVNETYFHEPYSLFHLDKTWNEELPQMILKIRNTGDDRSLAIFSALCLEHYYDRLLTHLLPRFNQLTEKSEFTLSMKIELLNSFNLLPKKIFTYSNYIRLIRNEFAHKLALYKFEEIKEKFLRQLDETSKEIGHFKGYEAISFREKFLALTSFTITGIRVFEPTLTMYIEKINSKSFKEELKQMILERHSYEIEELLKKYKEI